MIQTSFACFDTVLADAGVAIPAGHEPAGGPPHALSRGNQEVLLVEDDDSIAQLLIYMLERDGLSVRHLADGEAAHHHIETAAPPALVLLDCMLPHRDGLSLVVQMRRQARWSAVPVVMLTARSLESDIVEALESGASDYIVKPFQPQEVLARLRRLLGRCRA